MSQPDPSNANANVNIDAHPPARIAELVEAAGVRKSHTPFTQLLTLGFLGGVFIAFGAMLYTLVMTDVQSVLGFGLGRWVGGVAFSLGLLLIVLAGAELFTGNCLIVMAWADRKVSTWELLSGWTVVYIGNFLGALWSATMVWWAGTYALGDGAVLEFAVNVAQAKVQIDFDVAVARGIMCNVLVCLAIWLCLAAHSVTGKVTAIVFPIAAFVALGFEHSIANMFFIPVAILHGAADVTVSGFARNLLPVTLGNIVGGGVGVAGMYWLIYLRPRT